MGRRLDWYLIELERLLEGHISAVRTAEMLSEVEAHIQDSAEDLEITCRHGQDPEALAVERFGSPWTVAKATIGQEGLQPYWRAARWPMLICFLTGLMPIFAILTRGLVRIEVEVGVVLFCVASWFSRRFMPAALGVSVAALVAVAIGLGTWLGAPTYFWDCWTTKPQIAQAMWMEKHDLEDCAADAAKLQRGLAFFANRTPGSGREFANPTAYLSPTYNYDFRRSPGLHNALSMLEVTDYERARRSWLSQAPIFAARIQEEAETHLKSIETLQAALNTTPREAFKTAAACASLAGLVYFLAALALNGLCAGAASLARLIRAAGRRVA